MEGPHCDPALLVGLPALSAAELSADWTGKRKGAGPGAEPEVKEREG